MRDDDIYVRKCCGPFVVGYLGYTYPSIVIPWLAEKTSESDFNVRANVAKAFSQALGRRFPREAARVLSSLIPDERPRVRAAVKAATRNVASTEEGILALRAQAPKLLAMIGAD
ncbi:hypothetical protein [Sinorhizobium meliloti]|uniref:hypothetical protein n=1 Tax=Rhizobium meliloti TaxID=382 RepID=UPI000FDA6210|nr:hypothetical protein [Sinorhizobium meliloti]RVE87080.1 hypothetical protein CN238_20175 [Sinorhizobium meliloti]